MNPRAQLVAISMLTVVLVLSALAVVIGLMLQNTRLTDLDAELSNQARVILSVVKDEGTQSLLTNDTVRETLRFRTGYSAAQVFSDKQLIWSGGALKPPQTPLDAAFLETVKTFGVSTTQGFRVVSRREGEFVAQVTQSLDPLEQKMRAYWIEVTIALAVIAMIAGALLNLAIARVTQPLVDLAARVSDLDSGADFPATQVRGEVGELARALKTSVTALHETRIREARFLANASHELRTPVTALLADLEQTMSRPRSNEEMLGAIQRSQRTATHLKDLASNLLVLSRTASGAAPVRVDVRLLKLALDATDLLVPLAAAKGLSLEADGDDAHVEGDPVLLSRMVENLVSNAIKYTNAGSISVRVKRQDGFVRLSVTDTGIGIPEHQIGRLFKPFERANLAHRDGFGLGLAAVKNILELHGGEIHVLSREGGGSRFEVTLPASKASVVPA